MNDINAVFNEWVNSFNSVCDNHAPYYVRRVKRLRQPPWFSTHILDLMHVRNFHLIKASRTNLPDDWLLYKTLRNKVVHTIASEKRRHYKNVFTENSRNSSFVWRTVNEILSQGNSPSQSPRIVDNGVLLSDNKAIASAFNTHFTSLVDNYRQSVHIEPDFSLIEAWVAKQMDPDPVTFEIPPISCSFVLDQLSSLDINKTEGNDNISPKLLQIGAASIADSITKMFNLSILNGSFPNCFKCARVVPIHKSGSKQMLNNYRPISILPALSKILERHVYKSFYDYLQTNKLLISSQSGFRQYHSCHTALLKLTDQLLHNIDLGLYNGLMFLDLCKAFDLVDHEILIRKLSIYGVTGSSLEWFRSYLTDRSQFTSYLGEKSNTLPIVCGVPQGSILGPLLFLIFINDLPLCLDICNLDMFADDQTLCVSGESINEVEMTIQNDVLPISTWVSNNAMSINTTKTKSMVVASNPKINNFKDSNATLNVCINNCDISNVFSHNLLGMEIDSTLSWNNHVNNLCKKLSMRIGVLQKLRPLTPHSVLILVYNATFLSVFDYCCTVWGNTTKNNLQRIYKLQKRAARVILGVDLTVATRTLFSRLHWLPIDLRIDYFIAVMTFKILHGLAPDYLNQFRYISDVSDVNTRGSSNRNLYAPNFKTAAGQRSFIYRATTIWNDLPITIRNVETLPQFKSQLRNFLFDKFINEGSSLD